MARPVTVNAFQQMQPGASEPNDSQLTGPREYDVVGGEVRDWRRPETTPDAGPLDVKPIVLTDDDYQQAGLFLVPTDAQFKGRLYRDAPELADIAEHLMGKHRVIRELINADIKYFWKRKTGVSKGRAKIGFCKRASDLLGHFTGADFIIWLSATTAREGKFTDRQVEAAVFHQLMHIGADEKGNWIFTPHDFEGFAAEIEAFGAWTSDLTLGGSAFVAAHQMGLFTEPADDTEDASGFATTNEAPKSETDEDDHYSEQGV